MIDAEDDGPAGPSADDAQVLLYDFFKHMTSLSILILGGVLLVAPSADKADVKPSLIIIVLLLVSAGGVLSFSGSSEIIRARSSGTPARASLDRLRMVAPALLAAGVGMFLSMFVDWLS